jgi:Tol biopolymer transport system component
VRLTRSSGGDYWPDLWMPPAEASASDTEASALAAAQTLAAAQRRPIAFVSTRSGRAEIYTMNADGADPLQVTSGTLEHYYPAWSPDGTQIACYRHSSWQAWTLVVMNADGSGQKEITESTGCSSCAMGPYWSPDGTRIGFTVEPNSRPTCEIKSTELAVVNVNGTECRRLTENSWNDLFCGWSPDGATILFASDRDGQDQVYLMSEDGANLRRLTDPGSANKMPAWSPAGDKIAFVSDRDGNDEIYVMDADGANVTRITSHAAQDWMPAWSADGTELLFSSDRAGSELDVYAVRLADLTVRRLTTTAGYDYEAVWRP